MELTYDENKFVEYFVNDIYIPDIIDKIDSEKLFNQNFKTYSLDYIDAVINLLANKIELTEDGYFLKKKFESLILSNNFFDATKNLATEFTKDFTLDTIQQILKDFNIHQFKDIKDSIYRKSPFHFNDLFNLLNRPAIYHDKFTDDLSNIILLNSYLFIKSQFLMKVDIKNTMDNFQSENDFRLFPYYHYNHKPLEEENKDYIKNKYPEVFTDDKSFNLFLNIIEEFGSNKNNLANYSYIFHYLKKNNYIISNCLHKYYITILTDNNITISRIKPEKDIGDYLNKKRKLDVIIESFK